MTLQRTYIILSYKITVFSYLVPISATKFLILDLIILTIIRHNFAVYNVLNLFSVRENIVSLLSNLSFQSYYCVANEILLLIMGDISHV